MAEWDNTAIEELKNLYIETDIPSDPLIKDKAALINFTENLNSRLASKPNYSDEDVAGMLFKLRKKANLPKIRS